LYTRNTESLISRIEGKVKIKFKKIGAPQRNEIVQSSIRDIMTSISKIDDSMINLFQNQSKNLIEEYGAENAIARLLAFVSGHTEKLKSRSILCGAEGFITYTIKCNRKFEHNGYVWALLKRIVPDDVRNKIRGMRAFKTMDGVAFDYPEAENQTFEEIIYNDKLYGVNYKLQKEEQLPELAEAVDSSFGFKTNSNNNGNENRNGHFRRQGRMDVFIGNLPNSVNITEIESFIQNNGISKNDLEVRIVIDKDTGNQKNFGYISVYNKEQFDKIITLNGKSLMGKLLRINDAQR